MMTPHFIFVQSSLVATRSLARPFRFLFREFCHSSVVHPRERTGVRPCPAASRASLADQDNDIPSLLQHRSCCCCFSLLLLRRVGDRSAFCLGGYIGVFLRPQHEKLATAGCITAEEYGLHTTTAVASACCCCGSRLPQAFVPWGRLGQG